MGSKARTGYGVVGRIGRMFIIVSMAGVAYFPALVECEIDSSLDMGDSETEGHKSFVSTLVLKWL